MAKAKSYFVRGSESAEEKGPFRSAELERAVQAGRVSKTALARRDGSDDLRPVEEILREREDAAAAKRDRKRAEEAREAEEVVATAKALGIHGGTGDHTPNVWIAAVFFALGVGGFVVVGFVWPESNNRFFFLFFVLMGLRFTVRAIFKPSNTSF
jgi:hypothetical protein